MVMNAVGWDFEGAAAESGFRYIAGVDEAGRGPLAGPVVSAAVMLPDTFPLAEMDDSKKLRPQKREILYKRIYDLAESVGIGIIDAHEIDRINILQASLRAMAMAVTNLKPAPDYLLIDGKFTIVTDIPQRAIVRGDAKSISIAAASIVAKVTRDRMMQHYHGQYPEYGFAQHKGYPTRAHKAAILRHGFCPIHRQSFRCR
jgi:ribonuclease HII